jgi:hypothetical protein
MVFSAVAGVSLVAAFNGQPKQFWLVGICLFMCFALITELLYKKKPKKIVAEDDFLIDTKNYNEDEHRI